MLVETQVKMNHYDSHRYLSKKRWNSMWHQLDEIRTLGINSLLEIGPGPGLLKVVGNALGITVTTLDLNPELHPDYLAPATSIPLPDDSFEAVCAFQVLEHMPYQESLTALGEMVRVSRRYVIISLPDARRVWPYRIHIPKLGMLQFLLPRPQLQAPVHQFDGQHYWEINKRDFPLDRIKADFSRGLELLRTYRVPENTYHRFFVFQLV